MVSRYGMAEKSQLKPLATLIFATNIRCQPPILIVFGCFVKSCKRKSRVRPNWNWQTMPYCLRQR